MSVALRIDINKERLVASQMPSGVATFAQHDDTPPDGIDRKADTCRINHPLFRQSNVEMIEVAFEASGKAGSVE